MTNAKMHCIYLEIGNKETFGATSWKVLYKLNLMASLNLQFFKVKFFLQIPFKINFMN